MRTIPHFPRNLQSRNSGRARKRDASMMDSEKLPASDGSRYWFESSRPLVSLVFVTPMILAYEGGLLLLGPQRMRNGADVWLRWLLEQLGLGQYLFLPLLTCLGLLAWHHLRREPWHFEWPVLSGMFLESATLGIALLALAHLQGAILASLSKGALCASISEPGSLDHVLSFFGAGIYEELMFRLLLLPVAALLFKLAGAHDRTSMIMAIIATSLLFAAAHYRWDMTLGSAHLTTALGEAFNWGSFLFRFTAGLFFSAVFLERGFGIAVGAHALYDILLLLS
jgi:hypothetical protein